MNSHGRTAVGQQMYGDARGLCGVRSPGKGLPWASASSLPAWKPGLQGWEESRGIVQANPPLPGLPRARSPIPLFPYP